MNAEQQKLISDNYGIIVKVANSFVSDSVIMSQDDLIQEGFFGICRGIHKFNPERGKYSTFAYHCAKNAILKRLKKVKPLPLKTSEEVYELPEAIEEVMTSNLTDQQRDIVELRAHGYTQAEICEMLDIIPHHFRNLQTSAFNRMRRGNEA